MTPRSGSSGLSPSFLPSFLAVLALPYLTVPFLAITIVVVPFLLVLFFCVFSISSFLFLNGLSCLGEDIESILSNSFHIIFGPCPGLSGYNLWVKLCPTWGLTSEVVSLSSDVLMRSGCGGEVKGALQ